MLKLLKRIADNPHLNLVSGFILLTTSGCEIWRTLGEGKVGAHHGIAFFGLVQIVQSLPHILHATEQLSKLDGE